MELIVGILGGIWRLIDGGTSKPNGWNIIPAIFIVPIFIEFGFNSSLAYVIAYISLLDGFHGWHKFGYMRMHFTGYAAIACALADASIWYMPMALIAGLTYPTLHLLDEKDYKLPYFGPFDNYNRYCELITGFAMIFGSLWFS